MLTYLRVSDFALVEDVEIEFIRGFNALTGETGAGKTVLIGAIGLLLGDRAETAMVRSGAGEAVLEASFDLSGEPEARSALEELGYASAEETDLVLGRRLARDGKNRCTVNGRLCTVSALAEIGSLLVEVHGQNTHQALLKPSTHIGYLDRYAGAEQAVRLSEYSASHARLKELLAERDRLAEGSGGYGRVAERELLRHEIAQIESVAPEAGELPDLEARAARLRHARELWELGARVSATLDSGDETAHGVRDLLVQATSDLAAMAARDEALAPLAARVESLALETEDAAGEVERYREKLETEPDVLESVESRLSALRELSRKYGGSMEDALAYLERARERLGELEANSERSRVIEEEISLQRKDVAGLGASLSQARSAAAVALAEAVTAQMNGLDLRGAVFEIEVRDRGGSVDDPGGTGAFGPAGEDDVEFLFSSRSDTPARPLRKIASGGEMSRVMLALKIVLAGADRLPVLIFDEVDAGIGGEAAATVGEKLRELTLYHQVFCVTHLPQIAAFADGQFGVSKTDSPGGGARTDVKPLKGEDRVAEVCRMLGDSSGRKATAGHARDILERSARAVGSRSEGGTRARP